MDDTDERIDCPGIPDRPQCFDRPEPDRNNSGIRSAGRSRGTAVVPAGSERFRSMPLDSRIGLLRWRIKDRDVACLLQPTDIRRR